jgi:hypothetical protein
MIPLCCKRPQYDSSADYPLESGLPTLHARSPQRDLSPRPAPTAHRVANRLLDVEGFPAGPPVARTGFPSASSQEAELTAGDALTPDTSLRAGSACSAARAISTALLMPAVQGSPCPVRTI